MFLYQCLYFMISMCGFFILEIFYCLHLFDFVPRSPTLQNVIRSVTENGRQFMMTAMLLVIIINVYSNIGFFYHQPWFMNGGINKYEDVPDENFCITLT